ncbi:hypothetical protein TVAG_392340 [Trichomonas vaginalis G3]|uniref:Uncharacterized protein n=1 Tax=Trichomonas vaginalis (strain ATCC PRA-98 / G3) TaxID=412133 RepID=A2DWT5_TRIV3|nr:hypothetical protein TVAGG3_0839530 [Trichomonas vaginalis G3]EAY15117.1 hypothetical protein TVAG_392340 [Trichomonas vaginalis G3]KAI5499191.1 hypothetical protein TVAGG3_0839530 [Trichomonas vaginalis G3]|eukprot:XP_001327340.1 hypothetical protein [Trichomonas vaginalis G3]
MGNINDLFTNDNKDVVFGNRYSLGSRRTSIVDNVGKLKDDLFSACLAAGCIPSYNYWNDPTYMEKNLKQSFELYLPIYEELYHNHSFMANGYNKFSNAPSTFYSTWCARDGSGHCFASFLMGSPGKFTVDVQDVKSCKFTAPGTSCEVKGTNKVQVGTTIPYRTVVVEYWTSYMYDPVLFPDEDPTPETAEPEEEPPEEIPEPDPVPEEEDSEPTREEQPEEEPEDNPDSEPTREEQPEEKPEEKPEDKPEEKPEDKPEEKPEEPKPTIEEHKPSENSESVSTHNVGADGGDIDKKKQKKNGIIIGAVAGGLLFLALLATTLFFVLAKKRDDSEEEEEQMDQVQVDDAEDGTVIDPDMMSMQVDSSQSLQNISNYIDSVMIGDEGESIDFNVPQE